MSDVDDSQTEAPDKVQASPGDDDDSADIAQQSPRKRDLTDLREWCEDKRTKWPYKHALPLPESHLDLIGRLLDLPEQGMIKERIVFSPIESALKSIFNSNLSADRVLVLVQFVREFGQEIIIVNSLTNDWDAATIFCYLRQAIEPASCGFTTDPPFLGLLVPPHYASPIESDLLAEIGQRIRACLSSFK
jgi:hypothetical protein